MLWGIRGQRKATKETHHAQGNDTDAERQTNPLQYVGHLHLGIFLEVGRGQEAIGSSSKPETLAWSPDQPAIHRELTANPKAFDNRKK